MDATEQLATLHPSVEARQLYNFLSPIMATEGGVIGPESAVALTQERLQVGIDDGPAVRELVREGWIAVDGDGLRNALLR